MPSLLRIPWISRGWTPAGCHFLLQCMKVKSESEVTQSCPTLSDPMDCSLPGSSIHGIIQTRVHWYFCPSNEYLELISFRIDWFDLLAAQATLKSLLQHHNSKASILWHSAFFMIQLSHLYMTTGKTIALTLWTFVDRVMSLHFIMLSRFVIAFLLLFPSVDHVLPWGYFLWKAGLSIRKHLPWGQDHPA